MFSDNNIGPLINSSTNLRDILLPYHGDFKVAHMNCQSIRPSANSFKFDELKLLLSGSYLDVFAVSETWLKPHVANRSVNVKGYTFCRNDRLDCRGGGVGVYVSNNFKFKIVFKTLIAGSCESLFLEIYLRDMKILFGVIYLPYGDIDTFEAEHFQLLSAYSNVILVGDFNYNLFDSSKSRIFRSLCLRSNLSIVHNCRPTHYDISHGSTSLIDFMLVSDYSALRFSDQYHYPALSHHALILASFKFGISHFKEFVEYRDYGNINWDNVARFLSNFDSSAIYGTSDVDLICPNICSLFQALLSFVPIAKKRVRFRNDDWMKSNNITLARSMRDLAFLAYRSDKSSRNWKVFCKYRNRAKRIIRFEKRQFFSRLFERLDSTDIWRVLRGAGCLYDDIVPHELNVDVVNDFFVNAGGTDVSGNFDINDLEFSDVGMSFQCVSEFDVLMALNRVKSNSRGTDDFSIRFIKLIFPYVSGFVLHLFNSILTTSKYPIGWKVARVVPLPKSSTINGPEDLRPISILPALSKVMEHLLKDQILTATFDRICPSQYAFRKGYNTTSLLLDMTDSVRSGINEDKFSVLISLDLSKAFNSVNYLRMVDKLRVEFGFSLSACKLILSYLHGRSQFICLNGVCSSVLSLHSGVPQGSVLGPLLFILYVNDLPALINTTICESFLFADDIALLFRCNRDFIDVMQNNIEYCLRVFSDWALNNCLSVNASKTKAIAFRPFDRFCVDLDIFIDGVRIEFLEKIKFLGVVLDNRLSFESHVDMTACRILQTLRKIYSTNIFYPPHIRYKLAYSLLMPQVLYGLEVISGTTATIMSRMNRIVNTIVRFVYNIKRRDHISCHVIRFLGCSFSGFVRYRCLFLFYKVMTRGEPLRLFKSFVFSRSSRNPQILIPRITNSFFEKTFLVRVARSWNHLPLELRIFSYSNNVFRLKLLNYLSNPGDV